MSGYTFLDYEGLQKYDELIKLYIDSGDAEAIKAVSLSDDGNAINFYKDDINTPAYTVYLPEFDTNDLMKLVAGAAENNIAIFDANGQVVDSGSALAEFATLAYVGSIPEGYEATTVTEYVKEVTDYITSHGYDDTELKARMTNVEEAVDTLNGDEDTDGSVAKAVADAKEELTEAIDTAVANAGHLKRDIVDSLPDVSEADELTIYMVLKDSSSESDNVYDEYMVINGAWEKIGDTKVDLTDYATTEYVDSAAESALDNAKTYADSLADNYDAAGTAQELVTALEEGAVANNTEDIESLRNTIDNMDTVEAIPASDIEALF